MRELIDMPQVCKAVFIAMDGVNSPKSSNYCQYIGEHPKVKIAHEAYSEDPACFPIEKDKHKKFTALYFGRWDYAKGVDILAESLQYVNKDIEVLINSNVDENSLKKIKKLARIENKFYPMGQFYELAYRADIIICPHRRAYEYGESGMPQIAFNSSIPIIAPNFEYLIGNELLNCLSGKYYKLF